MLQQEARGIAVKYFAYGSNMLAERLCARVNAVDLGKATLRGWVLRWNHHSVDESGKCNIAPVQDPEAFVYGVLYRLDEAAFSVLDRIERGYRRFEVSLEQQEQTVRAWTYAYAKSAPDASPYAWYKGLVVAGAIQHRFPVEVVRRLEAVPAVSDPQPKRAGKIHAEMLLRKVGALRD